MRFTKQDVERARSAIDGIGADKVFALAMQLRDGIIQLEILKVMNGHLQIVALPGHPFYSSDWGEVNAFLQRVFTARPQHVTRVSSWASFSHTLLDIGAARHTPLSIRRR